MRKSFTKACALVMAAAMAVTGCGNASKTEPSAAAPENTAGESTAAATEAQNVKPEDIVDINVMVYDRGSEFSSGNSLTDNELTRWINEAMEPQGVHVNFVPVPRSGAMIR